MASRKLIVEVVGDSKSLERTFDRSTKASKVFGREVTGNVGKADRALQRLGGGRAGLFAAGAGFGIASQQITQQVGIAVDVASNLQEQIARTGVVFGKSAGAIEDWSETTASSMGIAQDSALEAAGTFGTMFDQAGLSSAKAAQFSKTMVALASDLASFNNASIEDTLVAIRSGLSGEIEPLRRFGVFLTEANVSQRAMAQSGKDNVKQLTQGEKILARQSLILEQTTKQQGDYERTSGSLANQQRALAAQTRDLQANIGTLLVPAVTAATTAMTELATFTGTAVDALQKLGGVKIPEIKIPFDITIGGSSIGSAAGGLFNKLKFTPLNPLFGVFVANAIAGQFRDQARAATPDLAAQFADDINLMTTNALNTAAAQTRTTGVPSFGEKGFKALPGKLFVSPDVEAANAQALAEANGELQKVLKGQIARRDGLKRLLDNATENFKDQKKIDDLAKRYGAAQVAVVSTEKQIASNAASQAAAAASAAESAKATAKSNREAAAATLEAARERARSLEQARQFRALGLDPTGNKPPPTIANLLKQIKQLGTTDLSKNERGVLARIRKVLVDPLKKATPETRAAAKGLIDGIRDELDVDKKLVGPLTKTTSLRANKLISGLGLGPDQIRELRARLSSFNSAGMAVAGTTRPTGTFRGGVVVENHNTVEIDGQVVGRNVTRSQQKNRKRNPVQKRGSRRGGV